MEALVLAASMQPRAFRCQLTSPLIYPQRKHEDTHEKRNQKKTRFKSVSEEIGDAVTEESCPERIPLANPSEPTPLHSPESSQRTLQDGINEILAQNGGPFTRL